ncbi:hypothetical protein N2152v2_006025 [Parachlorella kessleri]
MADQQAADGTRVVLRVRPFNAREAGTKTCLLFPSPSSIQFTGDGAAGKPNFTFDKVFADLKDVVGAVLAGYNGTIISYGQTGSGKTHTLMGDIGCQQERGIVPRAVAELAKGIAAYPDPCKFRVTLSVIEIYCERIKDLLAPSRDNLQVVQDKDRGVIVSEATELPVGSEAECVKLMELGLRNRAVSATAMNAGSSRSHCVVYLLCEKAFPDGRVEYGKLALVDLAGSERQEKTQAQGQTLQEGNLINKSLSCLGNVVNALTDGKNKGHIPYRDSKLTRVLQDSLGGTARTVLIICCSPSLSNSFETLSTLRFGQARRAWRAKGIQNNVQANAVRHSPEQLAKMLTVVQAENDSLRQQLEELQKQGGSSTFGGSSSTTQRSQAAGILVGGFKSNLVVYALQAAGLLAYFLVQDLWLNC